MLSSQVSSTIQFNSTSAFKVNFTMVICMPFVHQIVTAGPWKDERVPGDGRGVSNQNHRALCIELLRRVHAKHASNATSPTANHKVSRVVTDHSSLHFTGGSLNKRNHKTDVSVETIHHHHDMRRHLSPCDATVGSGSDCNSRNVIGRLPTNGPIGGANSSLRMHQPLPHTGHCSRLVHAATKSVS